MRGYTSPKKENAGEMLTKEYLEEWLRRYAELNVCKSTYNKYKKMVNNHLIPALGYYRLKELDRPIIQEFLIAKYKSNLSASTVISLYGVLKNALRVAVSYEILSSNPCDGVIPPSRKRYNAEILTKYEIEIVLKELEYHPFYLPVLLAVTTGARRSEIAALTWNDVDLAHKKIDINKTCNRINGTLEIDEINHKASRRSISLPDAVVPVLREHMEKQQRNKELFGEEYEENNFVCVWENGKQICPTYYTKKFKHVIDKIGIERRIRFYDIRFTHACLLLENGINQRIIQARLGWSQTPAILDVFLHTKPELEEQAIKPLNENIFVDLLK